jgi:membrane protein implicated in regulation of membrane protease activity
MKRTTILRNCTFVCGALMLALLWVNYWATVALAILCVIFAVAWLASDYVDYQREQERMKQYHNRLKTK